MSGKDKTDALLMGDTNTKSNPRSDPNDPIPLILDAYKFDHPRRGRAIIVNNHHFNKALTGQNDRDGTEVDAEVLERVFVRLGFDVTRYDDLTTLDMSINLREASKEDHADADCFALAILSHGENGYVYGTNGRVSIESIVKNFKGDVCPSLAGKPKLFFIQACRGTRFDWGVDVDRDETDAGVENDVRRIPIEADILMAYSVTPGYFSWRNNVDGSWFVQAIAKVFYEYADNMELSHMLTLVNKVIAFDFKSCTDDNFTSNMKQVPCIVSTLTKLVFFKPKWT